MWRSIGLYIGSFIGTVFSFIASSIEINRDNYTIYYGDLIADSASSYYFA